MSEPDRFGPSPLPFGTAHRPIAWTGTLLGLIALGMALSAVLFTYAYLGVLQGGWPPPERGRPPVALPALATLALLSSAPPALAIQRAAREGRGGSVQVNAVAMAALGALFLGLQALHYPQVGLDPAADAYSSAFVLIVALHHAALLAGMGAALVTALQVWSSPDARVAATAASIGLYWVANVGAWLLVAAVLYVSPFVWGAP
jgi:heme/copper-type cytochrome/quinol oxidase subunit 3